MDESTWFSLATKIRLFEAAAEVLDDPVVTPQRRRAARSTSASATGLKVALRALGSPRLVYRNIVRANAKFSAIHTMELARARPRPRDGSPSPTTPATTSTRSTATTPEGLLSVVPALFGLPAARGSPTRRCAAHGDDRCVYEVRWDAAAVTPRAWCSATASLGAAAR